jgi:hypothetical protein
MYTHTHTHTQYLYADVRLCFAPFGTVVSVHMYSPKVT